MADRSACGSAPVSSGRRSRATHFCAWVRNSPHPGPAQPAAALLVASLGPPQPLVTVPTKAVACPSEQLCGYNFSNSLGN